MADLRELIKAWREPGIYFESDPNDLEYKARCECADELERALSAQPAPAGDASMANLCPACGKRERSRHPDALFCKNESFHRGDDRAAAAVAEVPEAKVVPYGSASGEKDYAYGYEKGEADGWNACRRAMLSAAPQPDRDADLEANSGRLSPEATADINLALGKAPQPAAVRQDLTTAQGNDDGSPEVWINNCPVNHDRRATCPRCHSTRPPGAVHGQPVQAANPQPEAKAGADDAHCQDYPNCPNLVCSACEKAQPKPAEGGAVGPYHAVLDDNGHACAISDSTGYYLVHLQCGTTRNESEGGVAKLLRLLNAPAGSGEAVAWQVRAYNGKGDWVGCTRDVYDATARANPAMARVLYAGAAPAGDAELRSVLYAQMSNLCAIPEDRNERIPRTRVMDAVVAIRKAMDAAARRLSGAKDGG